MATQYTPILQLALPVTGELNGTWGDVVNDNITSMVEEAIAGLATISTWTANAHTLTTVDGLTDEARCAMIVAQTGAGGTALTGAGNIICPARTKLYVVKNDAAYAVTVKTSGGSGVAIAAGDTAFVFCDGTNVNACVTQIINGHITGNLTVDGNTTLGNATSDTITATARFASDVNPSADNTYDLGTAGNSWRNLYIDGTGTIATIVGTNLQITNLKANDGTAAGSIANSTGVVTLNSAVLTTADINGGTIDATSIGATTPSTGVFTQVDITAQGDLRLQDASGGQYVAMQAPATVPASYTLTWPDTDGDAGQALVTDGSGVLSWSTAASGDVYGPASATDNAVTRFDGTTGKLIQNSGVIIDDSNNVTGVVNLTSSGSVTLSGGTANGVAYLNGSKVLTTGSALTFDGSILSANSGVNARFYRGDNTRFGSIYSDNNGLNIVSNSNNDYLYLTAAGTNSQMVFSVVNSEQMRLTSTGLGIGTSSISNKLEIAGTDGSTTALFKDGNQQLRIATDSVLVARSSGSNGGLTLGSVSQTWGASGGFVKINTNGSTVATFDTSGNLGLGVTPSAWLSIVKVFQIGAAANIWASTGAGNTAFTANEYLNSSGNSTYIISDYASRYQQYQGQHRWYNAPSGTAGNAISFTQAMTLDASGNLGIGTSSPSTLLQLNTASSGANVFSITGGSSQVVNMGVSSSGGGPFLYVTSNHALRFGTNDIERMRIDSSGNVGIGTSSPGAKLEVSGKIKQSSGIYTSSGTTSSLASGAKENIATVANYGVYQICISGGSTTSYFTAAIVFVDGGGNVAVNNIVTGQSNIVANGANTVAVEGYGATQSWYYTVNKIFGMS